MESYRITQDLLDAVVTIATDAGKKIMQIYQRDFDVETKSDGSPLTEADAAADAHIKARLKSITPQVPILSEESASAEYAMRQHWSHFWLVDPLDGTKEFVNRNGQFTVNIALIDAGRPVLGVVYVPATDIVYYAAKGLGAFKREAKGAPQALRVSQYKGGAARVVVSRSHRGEAVDQFLARLKEREGEYQTLDMGSSLKICLVAEGQADIYPRLGPTSEWDIGAGQCVVEVAGGKLLDLQGQPFRFNKTSLLNPWFVVLGAGDYPWLTYFTDLAPSEA